MPLLLKIGLWVLGIATAIPILLGISLWGVKVYYEYAADNFSLVADDIVNVKARPLHYEECAPELKKLADSIVYVGNNYPKIERKPDYEKVDDFMKANLINYILPKCYDELKNYFAMGIVRPDENGMLFYLDMGRVIMGFSVWPGGEVTRRWSYKDKGWP